jgi:hypothetical protein
MTRCLRFLPISITALTLFALSVLMVMPHEGLVGIQGFDRETLQIAQARIARTEVIDGKLHPHVLYCFMHRRRRLGALREDALGQIQFEGLISWKLRMQVQG